MKAWLSAFFAPKAAYKLLRHNSSLQKLMIVPCILHLFVFFLSLYATLNWFGYLFPVVWPELPQNIAELGSFFWQILVSISMLLGRGIIFLACWLLGFSVFCSIYYTWMLEKVEGVLGVEACNKNTLSPIRQILDMAGIGLILLVGNAAAGIFSLLPVLGIAGFFAFGTVLQALLLGCEFFDCALSLRGKSFTQKLNFFYTQSGSVLGIGAVSLIFLPIPILNAALFTLSIVGATIRLRTMEVRQKTLECLGSEWVALIRDDTAMMFPDFLSGRFKSGAQSDWNGPCYLALNQKTDKIVAFDSLSVRWESENGLQIWSEIQDVSLSTLRSAKIGKCEP